MCIRDSDRLAYEPIAKYIGGTVSTLDGSQIGMFDENVVTLICKSEKVKKNIVNVLVKFDSKIKIA